MPLTMVKKPLSGWKRTVLNVFIALHVYALFLWGLPDGPFRNYLARPFERYVLYTGLWHIWGMFAPKPLDVNFDIRATVKYADGSTAEWICPRIEEMSQWQRMCKERYRKWRERIRADEFRNIWDDSAHWIARQMNTKPENPPVEAKGLPSPMPSRNGACRFLARSMARQPPKPATWFGSITIRFWLAVDSGQTPRASHNYPPCSRRWVSLSFHLIFYTGTVPRMFFI